MKAAELFGKQVLVLGLGKTGLSVLRYLHRNNVTPQIIDSREHPPGLADAQELFPQAQIDCREATVEDTLAADVIILSPGIDRRTTAVALAIDAGVPVLGDIELFAAAVTCPVVAVTGSNGKSTVTRLVEHMGKNSGKRIVAAGNIGEPALDVLAFEPPADGIILELSSFQLESTSHLKLACAALLNISADHLDRYQDEREYASAKHRIFANAKQWVLNREEQQSWPQLPVNEKRVITFGKDAHPRHYGVAGSGSEKAITLAEQPLIDVRKLLLQGEHNLLNIQAAFALANGLGIDSKHAARQALSFVGLPHRCQLVGEYKGIRFINDSKATNIGAAEAAIRGLRPLTEGRLIVIAGGDAKGADFRLMQSALEYVDVLITLGKDGERLAEQHHHATYVESLAVAVQQAADMAHQGDVVLLAPACASYDMFNGFEDRGEQFKKLVEAYYGKN
ncbi:UDP-N-acetylmuramoyl-L-alanine--D-glutamate ligase [Idiomarina tyrosinivorans]|uniref:UDP-N-acetylmuramoylalanine--D-glutamate ligase n=1 Tax=Idiomarina tyrosinivorans TaxID=1445662 RepID=A0A432ZQG2_9GAMM|nr:UDP-N-acetylmuramoyl-L-alanine--D-glutamate ligase [Idiomarina tyrosinivorans]RUO80082.1 UDP-N-acetylmuramoyl-L-alanine--D-glutamate ligase [Idiomarina tyrosinivorans]